MGDILSRSTKWFLILCLFFASGCATIHQSRAGMLAGVVGLGASGATFVVCLEAQDPGFCYASGVTSLVGSITLISSVVSFAGLTDSEIQNLREELRTLQASEDPYIQLELDRLSQEIRFLQNRTQGIQSRQFADCVCDTRPNVCEWGERGTCTCDVDCQTQHPCENDSYCDPLCVGVADPDCVTYEMIE